MAPVSEALLALAAPRAGERVLDVGCGCGASTLEFARAVGPAGQVTALDISAPMLAEGRARAEAAGIANVDWQQVDAATAALDGFDLLVSNCLTRDQTRPAPRTTRGAHERHRDYRINACFLPIQDTIRCRDTRRSRC